MQKRIFTVKTIQRGILSFKARHCLCTSTVNVIYEWNTENNIMQELFGNGCYRYNVDSPVSSADIQCMSHAHTLKLTKTFPVYVPPIIPRINVMFKARLASSISLESKLLHLHQPHKCLSANHFSPEPLSLWSWTFRDCEWKKQFCSQECIGRRRRFSSQIESAWDHSFLSFTRVDSALPDI